MNSVILPGVTLGDHTVVRCRRGRDPQLPGGKLHPWRIPAEVIRKTMNTGREEN